MSARLTSGYYSGVLTDDLSGIELETLRWLAKGKTAEEIAAMDGVHTNSIHGRMRHVRDKLGATTNTQAVVMALVAGMIE